MQQFQILFVISFVRGRPLVQNLLHLIRYFVVRMLRREELHGLSRIKPEHLLLHPCCDVVTLAHGVGRVRKRVLALAYLHSLATASPPVRREVLVPERVTDRQGNSVEQTVFLAYSAVASRAILQVVAITIFGILVPTCCHLRRAYRMIVFRMQVVGVIVSVYPLHIFLEVLILLHGSPVSHHAQTNLTHGVKGLETREYEGIVLQGIAKRIGTVLWKRTADTGVDDACSLGHNAASLLALQLVNVKAAFLVNHVSHGGKQFRVETGHAILGEGKSVTLIQKPQCLMKSPISGAYAKKSSALLAFCMPV